MITHCNAGDPTCDEIVNGTGIERGNYTRFRTNGAFSYDIIAGLGLSSEIDGLSLGDLLRFRVSSDDALNLGLQPQYELPNVESIRNAVRFSPQNAVDMLRFVDTLLVDFLRNPALEYNIPVINRSFRRVLEVGRVFSNSMYEFFVSIEVLVAVLGRY